MGYPYWHGNSGVSWETPDFQFFNLKPPGSSFIGAQHLLCEALELFPPDSVLGSSLLFLHYTTLMWELIPIIEWPDPEVLSTSAEEIILENEQKL